MRWSAALDCVFQKDRSCIHITGVCWGKLVPSQLQRSTSDCPSFQEFLKYKIKQQKAIVSVVYLAFNQIFNGSVSFVLCGLASYYRTPTASLSLQLQLPTFPGSFSTHITNIGSLLQQFNRHDFQVFKRVPCHVSHIHMQIHTHSHSSSSLCVCVCK